MTAKLIPIIDRVVDSLFGRPLTRLEILCREQTEMCLRVLCEIAQDRRAGSAARVAAVTQLLNRSFGELLDPKQYGPLDRAYYVYTVHKDGRLIYIGKGCNRRHEQSASRLKGRSRVRAGFSSEKAALAFEARLIKRFKPLRNLIHAVA